MRALPLKCLALPFWRVKRCERDLHFLFYFFFLPQFIIDSGDSYVKAEKLSGKENGTFRQVCSAGALPWLKHTKHSTLEKKKCLHRQFFIQKWPFRTCRPLTAWFLPPEGKKVKRKKKKLTDKTQTWTKETRMQCSNWILGGGRQVSLETNNLSWEIVENGRNVKRGFSHTCKVNLRNGAVFMKRDQNTNGFFFRI